MKCGRISAVDDESGLDGDLGCRSQEPDRSDRRHLQLQRESAGVLTPIVIGIVFGVTGSFVGPFMYIAVVALMGAFSYSVILGDIYRLHIDNA